MYINNRHWKESILQPRRIQETKLMGLKFHKSLYTIQWFENDYYNISDMAWAYLLCHVFCVTYSPQNLVLFEVLLGSVLTVSTCNSLMFPVSLSGCIWDLVVTKTTLFFLLLCWTSLYKAFLSTEYIWGSLFFLFLFMVDTYYWLLKDF